MSVPPSLDYSLLSTWQTIDRVTVCERVCQDPDDTYSPAAIEVACVIFNSFESQRRALFFFKTEQMGLRGTRFYTVYRNCDQDYVKFIQYILQYKIERPEEKNSLFGRILGINLRNSRIIFLLASVLLASSPFILFLKRNEKYKPQKIKEIRLKICSFASYIFHCISKIR